jgi:hypothetical protein
MGDIRKQVSSECDAYFLVQHFFDDILCGLFLNSFLGVASQISQSTSKCFFTSQKIKFVPLK